MPFLRSLGRRCGMLVLLCTTIAAYAQPITTPQPAPPILPVKGWLLMDYSTGTVLAEQNGYLSMEPASITKVMTSYLVAKAQQEGRIKSDDAVSISAHARAAEGSRMFVERNARISVKDLEYGMIIQSGNDATIALAEFIAGSEPAFVQMMNDTAQQLGLTHTHYMNSTGLPDPQHLSTPFDIATLSRALINHYPDHYRIYAEKKFKWNKIEQPNRNRLLFTDPSVDGIKTGHTQSAGYCLVSSAMRDQFRLIAVVLGGEKEKDRYTASEMLLNYGYQAFESKPLYKANQTIEQIRVWQGTDQTIDLTIANDLAIAFPKGRFNDLKAQIKRPKVLTAPLTQGQTIAHLEVYLDQQLLTRIPLLASVSVAKSGFWGSAWDSLLMQLQ